jgi:hypothetical protein
MANPISIYRKKGPVVAGPAKLPYGKQIVALSKRIFDSKTIVVSFIKPGDNSNKSFLLRPLTN